MMGVVLVGVCEEEKDATNERPIEAKLRLFPNNPCNNSTTGRSSLSSFAFVLVEDENSRCGNNSGVTSAGMVVVVVDVVVEKSDVALLLLLLLLLLVAAMVMNDRSCSML